MKWIEKLSRLNIISIVFYILAIEIYLAFTRVDDRPTPTLNIDAGTVNSTLEYFDSIGTRGIGKKLRFYKQYYMEMNSRPGPSLQNFVSRLERLLFPWLKGKSVQSLAESFSSDTGLVMCVGDRFALSALTTITTIRNTLKSRIPIEIFYNGPSDLSSRYISLFLNFENTRVIDISSIFDANIWLWALKPFAILASSFKNVILIDADVVLLSRPEFFFTVKEYQRFGAWFFCDRTQYWWAPSEIQSTPKMVLDLLLNPISKTAAVNRILVGKSYHEQESGVVVIDKNRHLLGLLAICALNHGELREVMYNHFWGDKETFWLGLEIMGEEYAFNPNMPGASGVLRDKPFEICSEQILHVYENEPLW
jgi:hypothetical protein